MPGWCRHERHRIGWRAHGATKELCSRCHPPADPRSVASIVLALPIGAFANDLARARADRNGGMSEGPRGADDPDPGD